MINLPRLTAISACFVLTAFMANPCLSLQQAAVRDSAGIRIVSNEAPRLSPVQAWRIDPEAEVTIGLSEGAEEYVFPDITAGVVLGDGTIVVGVTNRGTTIGIRFFDPSGKHVRSISGEGQGPGEFRGLHDLIPLPGDSVLGIGAELRYSVFEGRGEFVRTGQVGPPFPMLMDYVARDLFLGTAGVWVPPEEEFRTGLHRSEKVFLLADLSSGRVDTVTTLPSGESFREGLDGRTGTRVFSLPFTARSYGAAAEGRYWIGHSGADEIRGYAPDGRLETIIRGTWPQIEVTGDHKRLWKEERLGGLSDRLRAGEARFHRRLDLPDRWRIGFPERMPSYNQFFTDRAGNLWVPRYEPIWSTEDREWRVYDPDGSWITTVTMPLGILTRCPSSSNADSCFFDILEIGDDYLLTSHQDEVGVPRVTLYRLEKTG